MSSKSRTDLFYKESDNMSGGKNAARQQRGRLPYYEQVKQDDDDNNSERAAAENDEIMEKGQKSVEKLIMYKIKVWTSKLPFAGTKGNVYLQLYGVQENKRDSRSDSRTQMLNRRRLSRPVSIIKFPLERSLNNEQKFLPGQMDSFEIEEIDIGDIIKARIAHDAWGVNSGFHPLKITIEIPERRALCKFMCNTWISSLRKEEKAQLDLWPDENMLDGGGGGDDDDDDKNQKENDKSDNKRKNDQTEKERIRYDLKIVTSDFSKQCSQINLCMIGEFGETKVFKLNEQSSDNGREKFVRSSVDIFRLKANEIGTVVL
jgi:hypothetical protein